MTSTSEKSIPNYMKFVIGGFAGMTAYACVQPLDLVKARMQVAGTGGVKSEYRNTFHCVHTIMINEGPLAFYHGLSAGLLRQAIYSSIRIGIYTFLNDKYWEIFEQRPPLKVSLVMGALAGSCGGFIATPADVGMIRMMADGRLPPAERRNYAHVGNALMRIVREEGVITLWRGATATVARAVVLNMIQLPMYTQVKSYLINGPRQMPIGMLVNFYASMCSGVLTVIATMPLDIAKTRMQNMKSIDGQKPEYRGMFDVIVKVIRNEGVFSLWKGFVPYYLRSGPATVLTLLFLEKFTELYNKYVLGLASKGPSI